MVNFILFAGKVALVAGLTWNAYENRNEANRKDSEKRPLSELMTESSGIREIPPEEWRTFWKEDVPSHMTYERAHGVVGP